MRIEYFNPNYFVEKLRLINQRVMSGVRILLKHSEKLLPVARMMNGGVELLGSDHDPLVDGGEVVTDYFQDGKYNVQTTER